MRNEDQKKYGTQIQLQNFFHYFIYIFRCHLKENTFFGKKKLKIKTFPLHHLFMSSAGTLISIYVKYKHICRLGIHVP